jgi:hypothetical protein
MAGGLSEGFSARNWESPKKKIECTLPAAAGEWMRERESV